MFSLLLFPSKFDPIQGFAQNFTLNLLKKVQFFKVAQFDPLYSGPKNKTHSLILLISGTYCIVYLSCFLILIITCPVQLQIPIPMTSLTTHAFEF